MITDPYFSTARRIFSSLRGGTTANAIKAVDYFTDLKTRHGLNIVATNNSWGGGGFSQALQDAIGRANTAGILFVAAAGNSGANNDTTASYPSNYPNANIIAVADGVLPRWQELAVSAQTPRGRLMVYGGLFLLIALGELADQLADSPLKEALGRIAAGQRKSSTRSKR